MFDPWSFSRLALRACKRIVQEFSTFWATHVQACCQFGCFGRPKRQLGNILEPQGTVRVGGERLVEAVLDTAPLA